MNYENCINDKELAWKYINFRVEEFITTSKISI